ncbi:hypothetical protein BAC3_00715 [uncultured bacterium]|nr:hypothetical protein BAC3_00715 [uncultured bacterium]
MEKQLSTAMAILGLTIALGMSSAAFILGVQAKKAAHSQQSITVKGLAEKAVQADSVEWRVSVSLTGNDFADALNKLRAERPALDKFLVDHGLDKTLWKEDSEIVAPHFEDEPLPQGGTRSVQRGFDAHQDIVINTKEINKIVTADKDFLNLQAEGRPFHADSPLYLVGNLEDIKMSLISLATENARKRANEFTKNDGVKVGAMRSASQGAFYILADDAGAETDDYGGVYDKSTINKTAKVVVTIVYNIEQ